MPDIFSKDKRSKIMSKIKGKNTKAEVIVFNYLKAKNVYFQKHYKKVLGSPDIALPRKRRVVFIDGDFWHGWNIEKRKDRLPIRWVMKIHRNVKRDREYRKILHANGWQVMRVWEHQLNKKSERERTLEEVVNFLTSQ